MRHLPGRVYEDQQGRGAARHCRAGYSRYGARMPAKRGISFFGPEVRPLSSTGAASRGAMAVGALAVGAAAIGGFAIGRLAVGRLAIKRAKIGRLEVEELEVGRLRVREGWPPA